jgi:V/A-type H+-transporting ATPase subunit I
MIKYSFLLHRDDLNEFLESLRQAGMVHVETENVEPDDETFRLLQRAELYEKTCGELKSLKPDASVVPFAGDAATLYDLFVKTKEELAQAETARMQLEKEVEEAASWGDFDEADLERLVATPDVRPHFYSVSAKRFDPQWATRYPLFELNTSRGNVYFVILDDCPDFELQEVRMPSRPAGKLTEELRRAETRRDECRARLLAMAAAAKVLKDERAWILESVEFNLARLGSRNEAEGSLKLLTGWLPRNMKKDFEQVLDAGGAIWFAKEKLDADEIPPVLLKNGRFSRLFEPLTKLYSLPKHTELDPTVFVAPFFMLFFGFCLGDGGYGLFILAVTSLLKLKIKSPAVRSILSLAQWLGVGTLIFGFVTATFFGLSMEKIKLDKIAEQALGLPESYGMLCLALLMGFVQIIVGMCLRVTVSVRRRGWKYALAELAWIVIILGGVALIALPETTRPFVLPPFGAALLVAFFYNMPGRNPLINFGSGLWTTYNVVSGLLGDLLSYIRLFALGMTGGVLGGVFNTLALDAGGGVGIPVVSQFVTILILLFGHGLNFMLGVLGAMIHPMRLIFVEFYKNTGFEGGGLPFKAFGKTNGN